MSTAETTINVGDIEEVVKNGYKIKTPVLFLGDPAVGKSSGVRAATKALSEEYGVEFGLIDFRGTTVDPVDLRGMPKVEANEITEWATTWAVPSFFPRDGYGVFFIDEISAAPPMVQSALLQLVLDRRLGDYVLPENWYCVAAGNRSTNRAGSSKLNTALASRFIRYSVIVDALDWVRWAIENNVRKEIVAFIRWKPELLHQFDASADAAFPSPRTWEYASRVLDCAYSSQRLRYASLAGCIGASVAAEFCAFLGIYESLKAPEVYLKNPDTEPLPGLDKPAVLAALSGALAHFAKKDEHVDAIFKIANRLPAEFSVLLVDQAVAVNPDVQSTSGFIEWTTNHQSSFFVG